MRICRRNMAPGVFCHSYNRKAAAHPVRSNGIKIGTKKAPRKSTRSSKGFYLVEALIAVLIGGIMMLAVFQVGSRLYGGMNGVQTQIEASNMAQQVIDNARNQQFAHLVALLNGNSTVSEVLNLYGYPSSPSTSLFPRPLLRNDDTGSGMTYSSKSKANMFRGTVTETMSINSPTNDMITVTVLVVWNDMRGAHQYTTATQISSHGIHN